MGMDNIRIWYLGVLVVVVIGTLYGFFNQEGSESVANAGLGCVLVPVVLLTFISLGLAFLSWEEGRVKCHEEEHAAPRSQQGRLNQHDP